MRTTLSIDDELYARVRQVAMDSGSTISAFVDRALRVAVAPAPDRPIPPVDLLVIDGDGVRHGVDLDDSAALLDVMDAE